MDFSSGSQAALETALDLIGGRGQLILLHVIPQSSAKVQNVRESIELVRKKLGAFAKNNRARIPAGSRIRLLVRVGTPFQEILAVAKDHEVGLIVVGVRESNSFGGLMLGHTADRISRYAWCSVLLVRSGAHYPKRGPSLAIAESGLPGCSWQPSAGIHPYAP